MPDALQLGDDRPAQGVVHTQANLASSLQALRDVLAVHARRRAGQRPALVSHPRPLVRDAPEPVDRCRMLIEDSFHPRRTLEAWAGERSSWRSPPSITPSSTGREFPRRSRGQWRNVRLFTCGSAPDPARGAPGAGGVLGRPVINRYGMTEGHVITSLPLDGPWPQGSVGSRCRH